MKLIRFGEPGKEQPGLLLSDGTYIDTSEFRPSGVFAYGEEFFASDGLAQLRGRIGSHVNAAPRVAPSARLGPPIGRPSKIVCTGLNFRDHAAESRMELPKEPGIFFKSTTSLAGPNDPLVNPRGATKVDWEVELAVVIGRRALYVSREEALNFVAGYVLHNDYSERSF